MLIVWQTAKFQVAIAWGRAPTERSPAEERAARKAERQLTKESRHKTISAHPHSPSRPEGSSQTAESCGGVLGALGEEKLFKPRQRSTQPGPPTVSPLAGGSRLEGSSGAGWRAEREEREEN